MKTIHSRTLSALLMVGLCIGAALLLIMTPNGARAATATNALTAGQTGYWTNNASWNGSSYPGSAASETAYLNNNVAGAYTNILNTALPNILNTLVLSNSGGQATLIVTNATLTNTTLNVGTGGRLQIDNAGVVTNNTLNVYGSGGQILLCNGGTLNRAGNSGEIFGNAAGATGNGLVISNGGNWNEPVVNNTGIQIGSVAGATNNYFNILGGGVAILNGNFPVMIGASPGANNNTFNVGGVGPNTTFNFLTGGRSIYIGGSGGSGGNNNQMTVTNATLSTLNPIVIGRGSTNNLLAVYTNTAWNGGGQAITVGDSSGTLGGSYNNVLTNSFGIMTNFGSITIGSAGTAGSANSNGLVVINGALMSVIGSGLYIGGDSNNYAQIGGPGVRSALTNVAGFSLGGLYGSSVTVTNATFHWSGTPAMSISATTKAQFNILSGGLFYGTSMGGVSFGGVSNTWTIAGGIASNMANNGISGTNNTLSVNNGGYYGVNSLSIAGVSNQLNFGGLGALSTVTSAGKITPGDGGGGFNTITVSNAQVSAVAASYIGNVSSNNTAYILAGGTWSLNQSLSVGSGAAAGNVLSVSGGGILDIWNNNTLTVGAGAGNLITNFSGGVYQFSTVTPTITTNGNAGGSIFINGGVFSFRNQANVNVKNNWSGTQLTNLTWSGANAFRLNNSTGTNTYWFDSGAGFGATNYAGLEMFSGTTAYTNGSVTIGTNGWLTFSGTTNIMWGAVTNYGRMTFINSSVTFTNGLVFNGSPNAQMTWTSNSTVRVNGALALPSSMIFSNAQSIVPGTTVPLSLTASGGITGSPSGWTVYPNTHRVINSGGVLSLIPRQPGFLMYVY